jgi:Ca-activated chloride channel family protein
VFWVLHFLLMQRKRRIMSRIGDPEVVSRLMGGVSDARKRIKFLFFSLAWASLVVGAADPQVGSRMENVKRKGIDMVIALDVSNSMLAEDIKPNRLERSRQAISRLIGKLEGDRLGMVVFAGKAYMQMPVTTDYAAARLMLSTVNTDLIPVQGTAIGDAIELASRSFDENDHQKAIIVITDGENHQGDAVEAAKKAAENGIIVYTIGMGLPDGGPIPVFQGGRQVGFKKDKQGNTIVTRLNDEMLSEIAAAGNGIYVRANNSRAGLDRVFKEINALEKSEIESRVFSDYEHRFQYFLALAVLFLLTELLISSRKSRLFSSINLFNVQK